MKTSLTALLLVGGLSTRMGRDKATLLISGKPLWSSRLAILQELRPSTIWISAREAPSWTPPAEVEVMLDTPPSRGPLSGIAAALERTRTSHLLALGVDLPQMTSEHLRRLASQATPGIGVIPRNQDIFEPLVALYPKAAASHAVEALASKDVSMQSFVQKLLQLGFLKEYPVTPQEARLYLNLNRPRDLQL